MLNWLYNLLGWNNRTWNKEEKLEVIPGEEIKNEEKSSLSLYYPEAKLKGVGMFTQGRYKLGFPTGAVIHYHAGRCFTKDGKPADDDILNYLRTQRLTCFLINREGQVYQDFPLDEWGFHAGKSNWPGVVGNSVHRDFVGIEIMSSGELSLGGDGKFLTYFKQTISKSNVRVVSTPRANIRKGYYHKFSSAQEKSLLSLLEWLIKSGKGTFKVDNVVGHDEASPGRKQDPGGCLSLSMPELRKILREIK